MKTKIRSPVKSLVSLNLKCAKLSLSTHYKFKINEIAMTENLHKAIPLLFKALAFSAKKHTKQRRKDLDQSPYINHPIALANILSKRGLIKSSNF